MGSFPSILPLYFLTGSLSNILLFPFSPKVTCASHRLDLYSLVSSGVIYAYALKFLSLAKHSPYTDVWVEEVDNGNMVGVVMVDLSEAFDKVDHIILLKRLEEIGLVSKAIAWMESYLSGRSQSVLVEGCLSQ